MEVNNVVDIENLIEGMRKQYEEDFHVELINGNKRVVKLKAAISEIHDDVKEIRENTKFLTKPKMIAAVIVFIVAQGIYFGIWKGSVDTNMENVEKIMLDIKQDAHTNQEDIKELLKER